MLVIAAEYDYHNQVTLGRVKAFDDSGKRTIGIITKPDKSGSDEIRRPYIQLASNQQSDFKLDLGWHVMRNRDTRNEPHDFAARDAAEARFFEESSWAVIPRTDRGVNALRVRLSKIQFDHLRRSIPAIMQEMKNKLAEREEELDRLGTARSEVGDIRNFLYKKADAFQQLAKEAVEGRYHESFFRRSPDQYKLRAQLRNFSVVFDYTLRTKGAERKVVEGWQFNADLSSLPKYLEEFLAANPYPFADPERCTFESLSDELNKEAAKTRGLEFPGSTNDNLALRLFQRQSQKWEEIAQHHIEMVTTSARLFVERAMEFLIGPADTDRTTDAILRTIVDSFFEEHEQLLKEKLEDFILPYREAYALPVDREFITLNGAKSAARQRKQLGDLLPIYTINTDRESGSFGDQRDVTMSEKNLQKLLSERSDRNNQGEFAPGDVLDAMETYYEHIFTPTSVSEMSDDRVKELAKESDHVKARREDLKKETAKLKEALKYCNRYKPRTLISQKNKEQTAAQKTPAVAGSNSTPSANEAWAKTTALFQSLNAPGRKDTPAPASSIFGAKPSSATKGAANGQSPVPPLFGGLSAAPTNKNPAASPGASPSFFSSATTSGTTPGPLRGGLFGDAGFAQPPKGSPSRTPESSAKAPAPFSGRSSSNLFGNPKA
ncbi:dynamin family protein [Akanthomyces lecanii RCEF 1005]|uniref:Dynamin family protein n=1 Tax=Akanthomyces lecanii RCEF 1005 TaxID=1081108 RepID=A0A162LFR8_CORDF|nr:dynamin family protein [Akanthomyces lecanii RCEF 1005]